jgi:CRP-like cAMP-binding protein
MKINQNIFKTEMKESARRIKEAKAVFIFYNMPYKSKGFGYMRFKDFFMKNFFLEKVNFNRKILKQGDKPKKIMIIYQGIFALVKKVSLTFGYFEKQNSVEKEIFLILGQGSIIGEDEFLDGTVNSYSVKSLSENGIVYSIEVEKFAKRMEPYKEEFRKLLKKRHMLINEKIKHLAENKKLKQSIAGPIERNNEERSKEQYELHKKFSHAGKFPKRKFHVQLKKRNHNQVSIETLNFGSWRYLK